MKYSFCLKSPCGEIRCEADTYEEVIRLMRASASDTVESIISGLDFESHAKALYGAFKSQYGHSQNGQSPIEINGLEIDLARCFLQRMTILQAIEWLRINKNFKCSRSAVGRYWRRFSSLGFRRYSVGSIKYKG